jgi:hypothetical protein
MREALSILVCLAVAFYVGFKVGRAWELLGSVKHEDPPELDFTLLSRTPRR